MDEDVITSGGHGPQQGLGSDGHRETFSRFHSLMGWCPERRLSESPPDKGRVVVWDRQRVGCRGRALPQLVTGKLCDHGPHPQPLCANINQIRLLMVEDPRSVKHKAQAVKSGVRRDMEARKAHSKVGIPTVAVGAWTVQGEEAASPPWLCEPRRSRGEEAASPPWLCEPGQSRVKKRGPRSQTWLSPSSSAPLGHGEVAILTNQRPASVNQRPASVNRGPKPCLLLRLLEESKTATSYEALTEEVIVSTCSVNGFLLL